MMSLSKARREPGLGTDITASLAIFAAVFVFGGINIEARIMITGFAFLAVSLIGWILWFFCLVPSRLIVKARAGIIVVAAVFWICVAIHDSHRESTVIATPEYKELYPHGLYATDTKTARLIDKAAFTLPEKKLVFDGATSLRDLYESLILAANNNSTYEYVNSSRTPEAYKSLIHREGSIYAPPPDMIFVFRPSREQVEMAKAAGADLRVTPIGYDAFVFFVNTGNPVDNVTVGQLKDIYAGRVTNWRELGGRDEKILPFQRYEGSGSQGAMERFMEGDTLIQPDQEYRFRFMQGIVRNTARYRNLESAIGYSYLYYVETMLRGGGVKLLRVNGVYPSKQTICDRTYPLIEEICAVTNGVDNQDAQLFLDWILSPQGQAIVNALGYEPANPPTKEHPLPDASIRP